MPHDRRLGLTGEPANAITKVARWVNLGFYSFLLAIVASSAVATTLEARKVAFALWPGTVVLTIILFHCWRYYLRQQASLQGTTLVVTDRSGTRQCDLAKATDMTMRGAVFGLSGWKDDQSPPVLFVREGKRTLRLTLRNRLGGLMEPEDLHLIADAIESTPRNTPQVAAVVRELRGRPGSWTDHQDWSHRRH